MRYRSLGWLFVVPVCLAGCATTASMHGTLRCRGPAVRTHRQLLETVVYVEGVPDSVARNRRSAARPIAEIHQRPHRFSPSFLAVPVGTTVRFHNRDHIYHSVFSVSPARRFETDLYGPGKSRSVRFDKPGIVRLFSTIDPVMSGYVLVLPSSVYTHPDSTGAFQFRGLPRGRFRVRAWHPTLGAASRMVDLGRTAASVVTLRLRPASR